MKRLNWQIYLGISLVFLSAVVYIFHFVIFRDVHHIFIYLVGDIAFVFIEVLLVTLIIHSLLRIREKRVVLEKLNMLIGVFFSAVGTELLTYFSDFDPDLEKIRKDLLVSTTWSSDEFDRVSARLKRYQYKIEIHKVDLAHLKDFLVDKIDFLLRLLENPNLLEHESFTALLLAVFHLAEELEKRKDVRKLPDSDYQHLAGDIHRAYGLLVDEWLSYMRYLKDNYPYLFSLAMRTNPFDEEVSPVVS
jgi:hypothetical protein